MNARLVDSAVFLAYVVAICSVTAICSLMAWGIKPSPYIMIGLFATAAASLLTAWIGWHDAVRDRNSLQAKVLEFEADAKKRLESSYAYQADRKPRPKS